jgi:hypothetical protein
LSPENETFLAGNLSLTFTVSEPTSWIGYSLDGQEKVIIEGNATLAGLTEGEHNLTVYAMDVAGNTATSETVHFSVELPFPTTLVITSIAAVAIASAGLAIYFRKRNHAEMTNRVK